MNLIALVCWFFFGVAIQHFYSGEKLKESGDEADKTDSRRRTDVTDTHEDRRRRVREGGERLRDRLGDVRKLGDRFKKGDSEDGVADEEMEEGEVRNCKRQDGDDDVT